MFTVLVWLSTSQYTLSTSQYTHSTSQYTLSTSQYTLSTSQYILSTSQYTLSTSQYTLSTSQYTLSTSQYILSTLFMDWTWMLPVFRFTWKVFLIFKNENLMSFSLSAWAISSSTSNHYEEHSRGWEGGRQTDRQTDRQTRVSWLTDENTRDFAPGSCCCIWSNTCVMPTIFVEWLP